MIEMASLYFVVQPSENYKMEFSCDSKKDKPLSGHQTQCPVVELWDPSGQCRPGKLKVVCVDSESQKSSSIVYRLHRHKLVDYMKKTSRCDKFGVATFEFGRENYQDNKVQFPLQGLSIRRSNVHLKMLEKNWSLNQKDKFDPFGVGFGDLGKKLDLNRARLCCQVLFDDCVIRRSNVTVSEEIQNCKPEIVIHGWIAETWARASGGDRFVVFVSELKKMQREVCAVFFDERNVQFAEAGIDYNHSNRAIRFKVPPYTKSYITQPVRCKFYLAVKNEAYKSVPLYFHYYPSCDCYATNSSDILRSTSVSMHEQTTNEQFNDLNILTEDVMFPTQNDLNFNSTEFSTLINELTSIEDHQHLLADVSMNYSTLES